MSVSETTESNPSATTTFQPRIVALVCKWCTYAGADPAGTSRMTYPPNVRTIMLPCTGRIDVSFVVKAFLQGADGVIVSGCHPGDCHYTAGNYRARRRWTLFRDLLDVLGFDLRRFELAWISAAEGAKWVKTITQFTDRIRQLGSYEPMHRLSAQHTAPPAPPVGISDLILAAPAATAASQHDPQLTKAIADALDSGKARVVLGWARNATLGKPRRAWVTTAQAASEINAIPDTGNLARLFRNSQLKGITPVGIVARASELLAINVLVQESQLDPKNIVIFAVDADGRFLGAMDAQTASAKLLGQLVKQLPSDRPIGFSDNVLKVLDGLMARSPNDRWQFWTEQSAKCIKCYACRQSCPMCNCEQCFAERNQPQWFPTAADSPGDFAWHLLRAFHLAGRCVGCGACQAACPVGIPLNLLGAAMARSALKHFGHRAGVDPAALPLLADYKPDDKEQFIL